MFWLCKVKHVKEHLYLSYCHYLTYKTVNYSSNSIKINLRWLFWKKLIQSRSGRPPPKFQINIKIQLHVARVSRLSFRFLWLWFRKQFLQNFNCSNLWLYLNNSLNAVNINQSVQKQPNFYVLFCIFPIFACNTFVKIRFYALCFANNNASRYFF